MTRQMSLGDLLAGMARIVFAAPRPLVITDTVIWAVAMVTTTVAWMSPDPAGWLCALMGASMAHTLTTGWDLACAALDDAAADSGEAAA